jgi:hypothetical protein
MLSPSAAVPHTMLSPAIAAAARTAQTMLSPVSPSVFAAPQTKFCQALAVGSMSRWEAVVAPENLPAPNRLDRRGLARAVR